MRNCENENASKWIKEVEITMRRVEDGETMRGLSERMDLVRLLTTIRKGCKIIEDQTPLEDWYRFYTSRYCPEYGEWIKNSGVRKILGRERF